MGLHPIAEVFRPLTHPPIQPRIHPVEAARIVTENVLTHLEVVSLGKEDYLEVLNTTASGGWSGAKIYYALPLRCAARSAVKGTYTFNLGDSRQFAPSLANVRDTHHSAHQTTAVLDHRDEVLALGKHCAFPGSNPECFGKIIVDYGLFAATETRGTVPWFHRAKRAPVASVAATFLALFFNVDQVRLRFRTAGNHREFSASRSGGFNFALC